MCDIPGILADKLTLSQPEGWGGGGRLCPPNNNGTSGFLDLPTVQEQFDVQKMCKLMKIGCQILV